MNSTPLFEPEPLSRHSKRLIMMSLVLIAMAVAAYYPIYFNEFTTFDDPGYITKDEHIKQGINWSTLVWATYGIVVANWHPLTTLSHMLDVTMFGVDRPGLHHIENLGWHCINVVLLLTLMIRMTGYFWRSVGVAALFAVHPAHVESIAWAASRKDTLSIFFAMLTYHAYVTYAARPAFGRMLLTAFLLMMALMSKPTLITLPPTLLLLDIWPLGRWSFDLPEPERRQRAIRLFIEKWPCFLVTAAMSVVVFIVQHSAKAMADPKLLTISERIQNAILAYVRYLGTLVWPFNLSIMYPHPTDWPWTYIAAAAVVHLILWALILRLWPRRPYLIVGWLWFLGTLVPMIGIFQVGSQSMADRYAYFPFLGLYFIVVWGACEAFSRFSPERWRILAVALGSVILLGLILRTNNQTRYWKDTFTLFSHSLDVTVDNSMAHTSVANDLSRRRHFLEAEVHYDEAVRIDPGTADTFVNYAATEFNLYSATGYDVAHLEKAGKLYMQAMKMENKKEPLSGARVGLGQVYASRAVLLRGKPGCTPQEEARAVEFENQAMDLYQKAIVIDPKNAQAYRLLATIYLHRRDFQNAESLIAKSVEADPESSDVRNSQGTIFAIQGKMDLAEAAFAEAVRLDPNSEQARENLARVRARNRGQGPK